MVVDGWRGSIVIVVFFVAPREHLIRIDVSSRINPFDPDRRLLPVAAIAQD
jgi:hypothetical protein